MDFCSATSEAYTLYVSSGDSPTPAHSKSVRSYIMSATWPVASAPSSGGLAVAASSAEVAASDAEEYAHIGTEEKQKVAAECATAQGYLAETKGKLDALPKTETPPIKCAEIVAKADALGAMAAPIMNTPKPLPPKPEEPPPAAEGAAAEGEAAPAEGGEAAPAACGAWSCYNASTVVELVMRERALLLAGVG